MQQRSHQGDARVVDEAGKIGRAEPGTHLRHGLLDRGMVGHVHQQRDERVTKRGGQACRVRVAAHRAEYGETALHQRFDNPALDTR